MGSPATAPHGPGWLRWLALLAGTLIVLGLVLVQALRSPSSGPSQEPSPGSGAPVLAMIGTSDAELRVSLGVSGRPGVLSIAGQEMTSAVRLADGASYRFPADFAGAVQRTTEVTDAVLGPSEQLSADYASHDGRVRATLQVTVAHAAPALIYQLMVPSSPALPASYSLFDDRQGGFALPGSVEYLSVLSTGRVTGTLLPDDPSAVESLPDAPFVLWSREGGFGYAFGILDIDQGGSFIHLSRPDPGTVRASAELSPQRDDPRDSPRLYVERIDSRDFATSLDGLQAAMNAVAPQPAIPARFRQQWGSWYVYGAGITEELIRSQIDTIAEQYGDLGPWQMVIDAGWYLAGSDPEGQVGRVDQEKFPSGMRALVDYAHARGIGVVLYWPAPWVDSDPASESWWVVQLGFVRDHPDWLIYVEGDDQGATYVYDMANPELQAYLIAQLRQYLIEFNADGIEADMIGIIGSEGGPFRGAAYGVEEIHEQQKVGQTMEVYRFLWEAANTLKPGVWIESGYSVPPLARQYAHSFRVADDYPAFSNPYPFAGLLEQISFNALRQHFLGRRPNLGFVHQTPGDPDDPQNQSVQQQWLGAAVAMQAQVNLSVALDQVSPETARLYRGYLAALRPFSAEVVYGPGLPPVSLSTTVEGTTYLGLLNSAPTDRAISVNMDQHRRPSDTWMIAYDPEREQAFTANAQLAWSVPAEHFSLLAMRAEPGVLWGDRSTVTEQIGDRMQVRVEASGFGGGRVLVYAPDTAAVGGLPAGAWTLDEGSGLLTVDLPDGAAYDIEVWFSPPGELNR